MPPRRLQQRHQAHHVVLKKLRRVFQARRHSRRRPKMANRRYLPLQQHPLRRIPIAKIPLDHRHSRIIRPSRRMLPLQPRVVVIVEIVQHHHALIARREQVLHQVAANEASAASNQNCHARSQGSGVRSQEFRNDILSRFSLADDWPHGFDFSAPAQSCFSLASC